MYRFSNSVVGILNLFTIIISIPVIGGGLWLAKNSSTCEAFLQMPLLIIGFVILIISLAGFIGACFNIACALFLYLVIMLVLIFSLLSLTVFAFAVTSKGHGVQVPGRLYKEYHLNDYTPWLRAQVSKDSNWRGIKSCILSSKSCSAIAQWTPLDYLEKDMTPIQSGCCKPPTVCQYGAQGTVVIGMGLGGAAEQDCYRWNNLPGMLCYECDSCKAAVLEDMKRDWQKLSVLNITMLIILIGLYALGCCALRNSRRAETDHPYGDNRMDKIRPRWDYYWWRWWYDWKERLF
ncbi:unnamed protein product [Victoria cruziana]